MNTKQILAENTKRLRNLSKLSQFDFADEINMSKTVLSDIENARANPTLETIERLAAALHTTPALLLAACEDPSEMLAANFILSALDILQESAGSDCKTNMKTKLFPHGCSGNCYYRESAT